MKKLFTLFLCVVLVLASLTSVAALIRIEQDDSQTVAMLPDAILQRIKEQAVTNAVRMQGGLNALMFSVADVAQSEPEEATKTLRGDVDADGVVTATDARFVLRASVKLETPTEEQIRIGDLDKSGALEAGDARTVLRIAVKLEPAEEPDEDISEPADPPTVPAEPPTQPVEPPTAPTEPPTEHTHYYEYHVCECGAVEDGKFDEFLRYFIMINGVEEDGFFICSYLFEVPENTEMSEYIVSLIYDESEDRVYALFNGTVGQTEIYVQVALPEGRKKAACIVEFFTASDFTCFVSAHFSLTAASYSAGDSFVFDQYQDIYEGKDKEFKENVRATGSHGATLALIGMMEILCDRYEYDVTLDDIGFPALIDNLS